MSPVLSFKTIETQVTKEIAYVRDNIIYHKLVIYFTEYCDIVSYATIRAIMNQYTNRFMANMETVAYDGWVGVYQYNFGDVIFDEKVNKKCLVLN